MKRIDTAKKLTAIFISVLMCFCMCACGENGSVEETVEITTPAEDVEPAGDKDKASDEDTDKDEDTGDEASDGIETPGSIEDSGDSWNTDSEDEDNDEEMDKKYAKSPYKKIFEDSNAEMEKAKEKYVEELNGMASSISKSELYDETQDRIKKLEKIYDKHKKEMVDTMLKSTEDDVEPYTEYFSRMTEKYTEYTREITAAYTDQF